MKHSIRSDAVTFVSDSYNVEPWSLKFNDEIDGGADYVWRPPEKERLGTAVCFPLMGMLPGGQYSYEGKRFSLGMHGFAQDREFEVESKNDSRVSYRLVDDEETRARFPWRFAFSVAYSVSGATVSTEYRIENRDDKEMFFTVGGHPRFACPIGGEGGFEDYAVEFEKPQNIGDVSKSYGPLEEIGKRLGGDGMTLRLDYAMFAVGCFCFSPVNSRRVRLRNDRGNRGLTIDIGSANQLQFWTEDGGRFICIEPIYGSTSRLPMLPEDEDWKNRPGTLRLAGGGTHTCGYTVTIRR